MFNPFHIKKNFPILNQKMNGHPLVYLDNSATTQKPASVISAIKNYYETMNANIHRGIYSLSEEATAEYEGTRKMIRDFLSAASNEEIIFTKNCTEAINLVAYSWGEQNIKKGDTIVTTALEHHSNLVPWQILARKKEANLMVAPLTSDFRLNMSAFEKMLSRRVKLVCVTAMSNVLGV
ncbi:aminotransferase class V-fold PLP-dependent enzyme, partial [Candidatus Peregrinibacteria bacterium]|nr:aminotransferase class V-fold PLP-dependent enzyme [Candidatus Peregrinibacteria bacterium]